MVTHTVQSAKTHLSRLLAAVEAGEEVTILRGKRPVARLVAVEQAQHRAFGVMTFDVAADFDEPLSEAELAIWE